MSSCEIVLNVMAEETRAVVLEAGKAVEIHVERASDRTLVGSIFVGKVDRVLPGMACAFVEIGLQRHAFLYVSDAAPEVLTLLPEGREPPAPDADAEGGDAAPVVSGPRARAALGLRIEDLVKGGDRLLVQVARDPFRTKGARVTTHLSVAGRFLVHAPGSRNSGVSRRIEPESERERLRTWLESARQPGEKGGWIARTAAAGETDEALAADRADLLERWAGLQARAAKAMPPFRLHDELPLALKVIRDHLSSPPSRIIVDDEGARDEISAFLQRQATSLDVQVVLHAEPVPLFEQMGLEAEITKALRDRVWLKSGGYLVIDELEALVAIDVNTGKFTGTRALEDTALQTNLEAAREAGRQLRLRDLGGIVVIDFIDMTDAAHRSRVMDELMQAIAKDRAKTTVLRMSDFGLVELTRQRQRRSLEGVLTEACAHCGGSGRVRSAETVAMDALRRLRLLRASPTRASEVRVKAHPTVARLLKMRMTEAEEAGRRMGFKVVVEEEAGRSPDSCDILG